MSNILELKEQRAKIVADQRSLLDSADKENNGELTQEMESRYNKMESEDQTLGKRIEREEALEARQAEIDAKEGERKNPEPEQRKEPTSEEVKEKRSKAFESYVRFGTNGMNSEEREILSSMRVKPESRAQATAPDSAGGYTIDQTMASQIEEALLFHSGARQIGNVFTTSKGEQFNYPTNNDTGNTGALLAENIQVSEDDTTFGSIPLNAYKYTSNMIKVSNELIQDSNFDIMSYIANIAGKRVGRITNTHFTTGDGSAKPEGFMFGATDSGVVTDTATTIDFDNLIDLEHSVDIEYRMGAKFSFNDATLALLKKVKDNDGNYIWSMGDVRSNEPSRIMGYEYVVNNDIAAPAAGVRSVAFGDFSKFLIRDVANPQMRRLTERYADFDQTAYVVFTRHDSVVLDAGTNPIQILTQGA